MMNDFLIAVYSGLIQTTWIEAVAVVMGIVSVWYSRKENILVFPIGKTSMFSFRLYQTDTMPMTTATASIHVVCIKPLYTAIKKSFIIRMLSFFLIVIPF